MPDPGWARAKAMRRGKKAPKRTDADAEMPAFMLATYPLGSLLDSLWFFAYFTKKADEMWAMRQKIWEKTGTLGPKPSVRSLAAAVGVAHNTVSNYLKVIELTFNARVFD